jgi:hypothetical protein
VGEQITGSVELGLSSGAGYQIENLKTEGPNADITSAVVTVKEIDAHVDGKGWVPVLTTSVTIDLLKLDNQAFTSLGVTHLPIGHISELKLLLDEIGDYVVRKDGTKKPLEVPDNGEVKVVGKLDLDACAAGIVILDFDPQLKTEVEPGRTEYELKPVAKIKTEELGSGCNPGGDGGTAKPDLASGSHPDLAGSGSCTGVVCGAGEICMNGACVADPCTGVVCGTGEKCVNGACVPSNSCMGVVCGAGETCVNGTCVPNAPVDMGGGSSHDGSCHH